ncbi:tetratricopeptide repeat protein [Treponema zioleckii]|uniref:tetratricopeptide repeat protein n=1 Tax=Treponema zioleckii TaxID=331680 RepID=UPI001F5BE72D|nr:tetratricopeptide repeat protein [Treponema zioleckii]
MDRDITKRKILGILIAVLLLSGCSKSSKSVIRLQKLEEGVVNPTTVEELQVAIKKYQDRVMDIQLANGQVAIWYKMLGVRYLDAKMYGEALKSFEAALQFYPDNENLYYYVGLCAGYMSHAALDFGGTGSNDRKK